MTTRPETHLPLPGQSRRILLVEDSEPAIIQICDSLAGQGYEVSVARDGRAALAQIAQAPPDALILDLMMPEVDGFAVLRAVREAPATAHLPVLILTARHVTPEELSFLTGNHIQQLIQKGDVSKAELLDAVARMFAAGDPAALAPAAASDPRGPARNRADGSPVILVVEDNPDNLATARALLSGHYRVVEATDGRAGVAQALTHRPDLILMDIGLPVMDGIQALAALRAEPAVRHTPVIALTATAMLGDREEILAYGFDAYLSKPIDEARLLQTIREALHDT